MVRNFLKFLRVKVQIPPVIYRTPQIEVLMQIFFFNLKAQFQNLLRRLGTDPAPGLYRCLPVSHRFRSEPSLRRENFNVLRLQMQQLPRVRTRNSQQYCAGVSELFLSLLLGSFLLSVYMWTAAPPSSSIFLGINTPSVCNYQGYSVSSFVFTFHA